jgi:hypothetical protein
MRVRDPLLASWRRSWRPLAALLLCAVAALAQAQSADDSAPPDRVARLSYVAGDLGLLPAGAQDWSSADLNRPLTTGDRLSTGDGTRAELELGGASLRMAGDTDFGMLNLNDNLAQMELTRGTLNLSVRHLDQGQRYEIDTPTLALVIDHPGTFRVDVDNDGQGTRVTVFGGQATVYGENNAQHDVFQGRSYQFGDASLAALTVSDIGGEDAFDAWCSERDRRYVQSVSRQYVSTDVVGYQDLDQYGSWRSSPDYGAVWYPSRVPVGWAPYRDGHWAYIAPWGWTWVDDSPWGFAPYHYGRWAYIGGAWGWIPGPIVARPVYAPALVAFVGGSGWSVSIGIGGAPVGWFPLGPGEIYNPWYHCDRDYYRRVNVTNIYVHNTYNRTTIVNNINARYGDYRDGRVRRDLRYANRTAPHGFTAVSGRAFAGGQRVQHDLLRIDPHRLAAAPVLVRGVTAVRPEPRRVAPSRDRQARPLPVADFRRSVVARTPPPATLPAMHPNFAPAATRLPQRTAAPFANVRVLDGSRGTSYPVATAKPGAGRPVPAPPRTRPGPNAAPAGLPNVHRMEQAPPQPGALPSARFAHPRPDERTLPAVEPIRPVQPAESRQALRPDVNRVASPRQAQPQAGGRPAGTLPQPPRFERAPAAVERTPAPRYVPPRQEPPREYARPTYQPQPRYEQPPPRYQQPQPRYEQPQPRYAAPRPPAARSQQQHAEPARKPPPSKDDQRH